MLALGVMTISSVGVPLIVAGLLCVVAVLDAMRASSLEAPFKMLPLLGAAIALALVLVGINLAGLTPVTCPPGNHVQGTFADGARVTTYTCENGRLVQSSVN